MTKRPFFTIKIIIKARQVVGAVTKALAVDDKKEAILVRGTKSINCQDKAFVKGGKL